MRDGCRRDLQPTVHQGSDQRDPTPAPDQKHPNDHSAHGDLHLQILQVTEELIGPYELHDFFLFYFLRYGATPAKILYLTSQARFTRDYTADEIRHWLRTFLQRFFANQFKRSCLPDGPKVGSVSLSPRGDWRMPSDAHATAWLEDLGEE